MLSQPRIRYVPDWSGSMRQVAIYPGASPLQTAQFSAYARDPYGVYPFSPGYGFPYRGYMGPYGPPSYFAPYQGYPRQSLHGWPGNPYYGWSSPTYLPPKVSPWVHGSHPHPIKQRGGFSCAGGDCGFKTYGDRAATLSQGGVPVRDQVKPSLAEAEIEDLPLLSDNDPDWPLAM